VEVRSEHGAAKAAAASIDMACCYYERNSGICEHSRQAKATRNAEEEVVYII
jgi:hypothetical protein